MNYTGATITLNGDPYSITELLLLLWQHIFYGQRLLKLVELLWCRRDRCVRYCIVITEPAV